MTLGRVQNFIATLAASFFCLQGAFAAPGSGSLPSSKGGTPNTRAAAAANSVAPTPGPTRDPSLTSLKQLVMGLQKARLGNGLRVVMALEPESPTVSVCMTYDVGSRNEGPGQSGFAHLFEHMMFQGSRHVPKGKHFQMIASRGGTMNGTTNADRTNYFETLPANELELALWLEADRMRWLDVSQANLDNQRAVVKEEYRMRYENAPYRLAQIQLDQKLFAGYPPYDHPTIGNLEDLDRAEIGWVRDFHTRYYTASNAVLVIAGGFDPDQAMRWIREYFEGALTVAPSVFNAPEPKPAATSETRLELTDTNAKTPALFFGWRVVPHEDPMHAPLELLARILADGESSMLYETLVREKAWARSVAAYTYDHSGPDAFIVSIELTQNANPEKLEAAVRTTLKSLGSTGPDLPRLNRALQRAKSSFLFDLQSNQSRATTFGEYEVIFGDARILFKDLERLLTVTPDEIRRAAAQFVRPELQTFVRVNPVENSTNTVKGSDK